MAWCRERGVKSVGHFMEHGYLYVHPQFCAGDMMRLQKYSDMGGIDLVVRQTYPGQRPHDIYQTPKLASSITHVLGKAEDITMCENLRCLRAGPHKFADEMADRHGPDQTRPQHHRDPAPGSQVGPAVGRAGQVTACPASHTKELETSSPSPQALRRRRVRRERESTFR